MTEKTLGQNFYNKLKLDIAYGKFKPGEHLSGRILAETYNISRTLIREVLGQLDSEGFVTIEQNKGAFVTKLTVDDFDVVFNIIIRCESYATALFIKNWNPAIVNKIKTVYNNMKSIHLESSQRDWLKMNDQFHGLIYLNCGNTTLSYLIHNSWLRIYRFRLFRTDLPSLDSYDSQHGEILAAICKKNEKLAEKLMANHLKYSREKRIRLLKEFEDLF